MDSISQSNIYLPAWAIRYLRDLVHSAGHEVTLSEWWVTEAMQSERVGYCVGYGAGCSWLWRDYELAEMYSEETLDFAGGMIVRQIERMLEG